MLISRSGLAPILPNLPPEWTGTPNPTWTASVGGVFEMADFTFDQEGDALTYTLNAGSAALPTGVTISGSTLVGSTSVVQGSTGGIIIDVKDATSSLIASSSFYIVVSAAGGSSPTLWQDYGGNDFAGEAGALAVNDAWASTVYDYTPTYAPTIPTIPEPTTGTAFSGTNEVNPNAADEYLAYNRAGLVAALNNATYRVVFMALGNDFTDGANNDELTLTISGTSGTPRWFVGWDTATPGNIQDIKPWLQAQGDRALCPRFIFDVANYTYSVGLSYGSIGIQVGRCCLFENSSHHNLHYRCNMENALSHSWDVRATGTPRPHHNVAYQCVSHNHDNGFAPGGGDVHAFVILGGDDNHVVSCEGWDILGDFFHVEDGGANAPVCEDCDIYNKTFTDGAGNIDPNGDYHGGENPIDMKNLNPDGVSIARIWGNRIGNARKYDPILHPGSGGGVPIVFSNGNSTEKNNCDARWNVIWDSADRGIGFQGPWNALFPGGHHSLVRNILTDIRGGTNKPVLYLSAPTTEVYLNTITDCATPNMALASYWRLDGSDIDTHDCMGNWFQDVNAVTNTGQWGANFKFGYNAWSGTYTVAYLGYTLESNYLHGPTKSTLNMGDFIFRARKMTISDADATLANGGLVKITGIVPTSSTPITFRTLTPIAPATNGLGSRSGIGVDDIYL